MAPQSNKKLLQQPCLPCTGRGYTTCTICGGAGGTYLSKSRLGSGGRLEFYQERVPCTFCFGTGRVTCPSCRGVGWVLANATPRPPEVKPPHPNPALPANPGPPASLPAASQPFSFQDYQFVYHPAHRDIWACWQHNPGNVLDVGWASTSTKRIDVAACRRGTWLPVLADDGQALPLAIFVDMLGELLGHWL
jgi:hypothetical protein